MQHANRSHGARSSLVFVAVALGALQVAACGGRIAAESLDEDTGASVSDTGGSGPDGGVVGDSGIGDGDHHYDDHFDEGVILDSGGTISDGGVIVDSGGGTSIDGGLIDSGGTTTDSGIIVSDTGVIFDSGKDSGLDSGTIDATCSSLADSYCTAATKTCCSTHGFTYDDLGCRDWASYSCKVGFDEVIAGKATYDSAQLAACKSSRGSLETTCSVPLFTWVKGYSPCSKMFNGTVPPGGSCVNAYECKSPSGSGAADCDKSSKRCRTFEVVSTIGASCNYFGSAVKWCDYGLTCDYASGGVPTCKKATPVGGACIGVDDPSCGVGYSCNAGTCAVGAPQGTSCTYDLECASWSCSIGKCTDPNFEMANKTFCSGG